MKTKIFLSIGLLTFIYLSNKTVATQHHKENNNTASDMSKSITNEKTAFTPEVKLPHSNNSQVSTAIKENLIKSFLTGTAKKLPNLINRENLIDHNLKLYEETAKQAEILFKKNEILFIKNYFTFLQSGHFKNNPGASYLLADIILSNSSEVEDIHEIFIDEISLNTSSSKDGLFSEPHILDILAISITDTYDDENTLLNKLDTLQKSAGLHHSEEDLGQEDIQYAKSLNNEAFSSLDSMTD